MVESQTSNGIPTPGVLNDPRPAPGSIRAGTLSYRRCMHDGDDGARKALALTEMAIAGDFDLAKFDVLVPSTLTADQLRSVIMGMWLTQVGLAEGHSHPELQHLMERLRSRSFQSHPNTHSK